jgi:hypothetical protein
MRTYQTIIAGRQMRAAARAEQAPLVDDVLRVIARIAENDPPRDGLSVRLGWTVLTLAADGDGFVVCEPDFANDPLAGHRPEIAASLDVLAGQSAFARACGVEPVDAGFDSLVIVAAGALTAPSIQGFREEQDDPEDSGWTLTEGGAGKASNDADDYEAIHSYRLLALRPAILPALVLPPNYGFILDAGKPLRVVAPNGH